MSDWALEYFEHGYAQRWGRRHPTIFDWKSHACGTSSSSRRILEWLTCTLTFGPPRMTERISVSGSRGSGEYEGVSPVRMACGSNPRRHQRSGSSPSASA